jgi:group II intron reverse transcriptase/maturase
MGDTSRSQTISTQLQQIAEQAVNYPKMVFRTLAHRIDEDFLQEAYRRTRKDAAPGVDGVTAEEYAEKLEENLKDLHERLRSGRYKAPPVERVWLDKEDGGKRPIGKATFEDKIVQRAVVMLLGAIYEQDFYDFSHGFREGHSQHQALQELREQCLQKNIRAIVDADVSGFFDSLDHDKLREIIKQRVKDGGILRLIGKWLNAGVQEGDTLTYPESGTPQGAVISPMLSNIFLHYVLDDWFVKAVQPRMKARCFLIRYGDDFIMGCEVEEDARRIMEVLPKRFGRFGLVIHPKKTALVRFRKPREKEDKVDGNGTFEFLGFTHYWAKTRRGFWVLARKTAKKRLIKFVKATWQWCRSNSHQPIKEQHRVLCLKLRGFYQYYGVRMNIRALQVVRDEAERAWRHWLSRRSSKGKVSWDKFDIVSTAWPLPRPRIVHSI